MCDFSLAGYCDGTGFRAVYIKGNGRFTCSGEPSISYKDAVILQFFILFLFLLGFFLLLGFLLLGFLLRYFLFSFLFSFFLFSFFLLCHHLLLSVD